MLKETLGAYHKDLPVDYSNDQINSYWTYMSGVLDIHVRNRLKKVHEFHCLGRGNWSFPHHI